MITGCSCDLLINIALVRRADLKLQLMRA